jgi:hypothetical protein
VRLSIPRAEHHGTTGSSSSVPANPISNPAQPGNTVNVPVGTPAPRSRMVSGPFCVRRNPSPASTGIFLATISARRAHRLPLGLFRQRVRCRPHVLVLRRAAVGCGSAQKGREVKSCLRWHRLQSSSPTPSPVIVQHIGGGSARPPTTVRFFRLDYSSPRAATTRARSSCPPY